MEDKKDCNLNPSLNYDSPQSLRSFLDTHGLGMQKKFGQNFLINPAARERLLDELGAEAASYVWEVGPGLGAMSSGILQRGLRLCAFEIDRGFSKALKELFGSNPDFRLVEGDALKTWQEEAKLEKPDYFMGNLPYNIAATLIGSFIEGGLIFKRSVITVQKEVGLRMNAVPGSSDYSSLSVLCASAYRTRNLMTLKGSNFYPVPHVDSLALCMEQRTDIATDKYSPLFRSMVRALFASRRKTLKNNLVPFIKSLKTESSAASSAADEVAEATFAAAGISGSLRAERVSLDEFFALYTALEDLL